MVNIRDVPGLYVGIQVHGCGDSNSADRERLSATTLVLNIRVVERELGATMPSRHEDIGAPR